MHKSNHAIDAIEATHWSIYAQVPEEEWGDVVDVDSFGKQGYVPGRFLNADKTARLTTQNDPARGLIYCQRCDTDQMPKIGRNRQTGAQRYVCGECMSIKIDMIPGKEPTGDYAI